MVASIGVLYGILALFAWGLSDFFAKIGIARYGHFRSAFWVQFFELFPFLFLALFFWVPFSFFDLFLFVLIGLFGGVGFMFFYRSIGRGYLSIISPTVASWAVITSILSIVFLNEVLGFMRSFAISTVFVGIVLASFHYEDLLKLKFKNALPGVRQALVAVACFGISMFLIGLSVSRVGWFLPVFFLRLFSFSFFVFMTRFDFSRVSMPTGFSPLLLGIGFLEGVGIIGFGLGATSEYVAIVSPVAAASPMVCVVLARIFLKERISINQFLGVLLILAGVVFLAL